MVGVGVIICVMGQRYYNCKYLSRMYISPTYGMRKALLCPAPHFHSIALKVLLPYTMMSPFSSLDSQTTSAVLKRKQMVVETSSSKKIEDIPSVLFLGDDTSPPSPLLDAAAPAASEVSSSKRLKSDSAPAAATAPAFNERDWALAASKNNGQNVFPAYLANMTQLPPQQLPRSQQLPLAAVPQLVTPKDNASFEAYLTSVGKQQQRVTPKQPKPLTKAKRNKLEAAAMIEEINAINLDDENEIYDSCPEVAAKIKQFLKIPGVNRKIFLEGISMDESYETLKKFIGGTGQTQCRSKVYKRA
jgi:hypothetical protein